MKKILLLASLCLTLNRISAATAYDPFADATASGGTSYTVGGALTNQFNTNLFAAWYSRGGTVSTASQPMIIADNLNYPNMQASTGNAVSVVPGTAMTACQDMNIASPSTNTVYYSFRLKVTDLSAVPTTAANNPMVAFIDDPTHSGNQIARLGARLLTKKVGSGYVLGTSKSATTTDFVYEPDAAAHNLNDVVLVVCAYQQAVNNQTNLNLWINPPPSSFGSNAAPAPTLTATSGLAALANGNSGPRGFGILCQFATAPSATVDELRLATNWAFATRSDPAIVGPPANRAAAAGNNASFSVTAQGTATLTYQWLKDGITLTNGGNISGAKSATLTVGSIGAGDLGAYSVYVTNGAGSYALSSSGTLSFLTDPAITGQPQDLTTNVGTTATFQVTATGTAPITYQWHKEGVGDLSDGGNISGSHTNILTLTGVAFSDGGNYSVTISNNFGPVDSQTAVLTVLDPYISTQPVSVTTNAGSTATFHAAATGTGSFTYSWLRNLVTFFDGGNVSGTSTDTLTLANVSATDQAGYSLVVIGANGSVTSSVANLTVLTPVSIAIQPGPRTVAAGAKVALAVGAAGSGPLSYQWQREGVNVTNATGTTAALVFSNVQASAAGNYQVVVTNLFSSITSSVALLSVSNSLTLAQSNLVVIRVGDGSQSLSLNGNSMFLDQYDVNGNYVNTVTLPDSGPTAIVAIGPDNLTGINNGSTTGSCLTRSLDARFMVVAGYATNLNYGANLSASLSTNVPRGIGLIESHAQYTLPAADTSSTFDATLWRAGITDGTNNFWGAGGVAGTYYFGFDAAPALIQTNFANLRSMGLFNGDIYCAGAVAGKNGVLKITGMPKVAVTPTLLFTNSTGTFDMVVNPAGNLIYVADQRSVVNGGGIRRYDFDGVNLIWNFTYVMTGGMGSLGPRYVEADFSGANPVIYATSNDSSLDHNRILVVTDTGNGSTAATLAYAGANQTLRGIRFGPIVNPTVTRPVLTITPAGGNVVLTWSGAFTLQSATNVTGSYLDVSGATSPYTNGVGTNAHRFYRLRN